MSEPKIRERTLHPKKISQKRTGLKRIRWYLIYILILLWILWPIAIMILESVRIDLSPLLAGKGFSWIGGVPFFSGGIRPSIINYFEAFAFAAFPRLVYNSSIIALSSVITCLIIGTPAAYSLARFRFRGKSIFEFMILTLRTISPFAVIVPFYWIYGQLGLWNTFQGMMVVYWVINLPIVVWMMRGFFADIPRDIWEAATLYGASEFTIFRKIAMPIVIPGLIATIIFAFVLTWNEFLYASILTGPATKTVTAGIWLGMGEGGGFKVVEWDDINTGGVLAFIPAVLLILVIRRYLVRGFTLGSSR
jgi:multiple sugar transport system permease protein